MKLGVKRKVQIDTSSETNKKLFNFLVIITQNRIKIYRKNRNNNTLRIRHKNRW